MNEAIAGYQGVKVFSATGSRDRSELGERVTRWLSDQPSLDIVNKTVMQSSDNAFHCITILLFWRKQA